MPIMLAPLRLSTPTTRNDTFWMRMSLPIGDSPSKQLAGDRPAEQADLARVAHVALGERLAFVELLPVADVVERPASCRR